MGRRCHRRMRTGSRKSGTWIRAYVAEAGTVAFVSLAVLITLIVLAESARPGTAANYVSPQSLFVAAVVTGLLSLAAPIHAHRSRRQKVTYSVLMVFLAVIAFKMAWRYFAAIPSDRVWLSLLASGSVLLVFLAFGQDDRTDGKGVG